MQWASHLLYKQPLALEETNNKLYSGVHFYEMLIGSKICDYFAVSFD